MGPVAADAGAGAGAFELGPEHDVLPPWRWPSPPACAGVPLESFYVEAGTPKEMGRQAERVARTARAFCAGCPVRRECGRWAVASQACGLHAGCYRPAYTGPWRSLLAGVEPLPSVRDWRAVA